MHVFAKNEHADIVATFILKNWTLELYIIINLADTYLFH